MYKRETNKQRKANRTITYVCCLVCKRTNVQLLKKNKDKNEYVCVDHK